MARPILTGRRVGTFAELDRAGDYYGPTTDIAHADGHPRIYFVAPAELWPGARGVASVASPPHAFRECPDGSVEVRESILIAGRDGEPTAWHGYLDEGHRWREV